MDKYSLITSQKRWFFKEMVEYVSKLYFNDLPEGNVLNFDSIKAKIRNKIEEGINVGDIVEGVVGEWQAVVLPDEVSDYFDIDYNFTCLSTSEVRGYLRKLVRDNKLDVPDAFKQKFLGMELETSENVAVTSSVKPALVEQEGRNHTSDCFFRKMNQSWHIKYNDSELMGVKDLVGMSYIHLLLQSPRKSIGVIELQAILNGHQVKQDHYDESTANGNEDCVSISSTSGVTKNSSSMNILKKRLQELYERRAIAEKNNDFGAIELIDNEVEQIQEQIDLIQYGKQDKDPELEANRKKVAKNIRDSLVNIRKLEIAAKNTSTPIYNYMKTHIKTGLTCCYTPPLDSQPSWIF